MAVTQTGTKGRPGHAKKLYVSLDGTDWAKVHEVINISSPQSFATISANHRDNPRSESKHPGRGNKQISGTMNQLPNDLGQERMRAAADGPSFLYVKLLYEESVGAPKRTGRGAFTNFGEDDADAAAATISFTLDIDGDLTAGVVALGEILP